MIMGFVARNGFIHLARASSRKHHSFLELASYSSFFFQGVAPSSEVIKGLIHAHIPINKISSLFMAEKLKLQVCLYAQDLSHSYIWWDIDSTNATNTRDVFVLFIYLII